jgi:eukaryotic-like serine/threonine-protein kinase
VTSHLDELTAALSDRYVIERELGRGGMAIVYLAYDSRHRRKVAIKVLNPEVAATVTRERFLREIEIAARLAHPNILPLHDSGAWDTGLYYVMPYVDAESLRDRLKRKKQLSIDEAVEITSQIASALDYAHRQNVIHRDIKPENILLHEGGAMVADFGIAFAALPASEERLTDVGFALGTPEYTSPEQAAGRGELDGRSDIYSLACVLYEMLAGDPPFTGANAQAILARQVVDHAPPIATVRPTISKTIARALAKALNKVPADRFGTATAFARALSAPSSTRPELSSIAVLPLTNLSADPEQEYFSDGITEALIADLAKVRALKVISRTSVMRYKNSNRPLPEIARELGVEAIVEGTVQRVGDQVRITAQLIDATSDSHLWAETYDRSITNVLSLQGEVARAIVQQIKVKLTSQEEARLVRRTRVNPLAHDAYLRGRYHLNKTTPTDLTEAISRFNESIEHDSRYALAYAGLANAYNYLGWLGGVASEVFPKAKKAAFEAIELDDTLAEAHAVLGYTATLYDWDWALAQRECERAIDLNPNYAEGYLHYSWYLCSQGSLEEARVAITKASEFDPLSLVIHANMANYFQFTRDYDGMLAQTRRTLELAPTLPLGLLFSGLAYCGKGQYEEATAVFQQLVDVAGSNFKGYLGYAFAKTLRNDRAFEILAELMNHSITANVPSFQITLVFIGLNQTDDALDWLERAAAERAGPWFPFIRHVSLFDPLRSNPRFERLVREMNFPESP